MTDDMHSSLNIELSFCTEIKAYIQVALLNKE